MTSICCTSGDGRALPKIVEVVGPFLGPFPSIVPFGTVGLLGMLSSLDLERPYLVLVPWPHAALPRSPASGFGVTGSGTCSSGAPKAEGGLPIPFVPSLVELFGLFEPFVRVALVATGCFPTFVDGKARSTSEPLERSATST